MTNQKRSEKLTKSEHKAFKKWVDGFKTKELAALKIGVARQNLYGLIDRGSGKPTTIKRIRKQLA